jgi:cellobiose phosphorylase
MDRSTASELGMTPQHTIALLSNGTYAVMMTGAGGGYSSWRNMDVTRWREDSTRDCWGQFIYVRDLGENRIWPACTQPLIGTGRAEFLFRPDRAEFHRRDGDIETRCAVCVAPDADVELRVVTLVNHGSRREIELTSYAEISLNDRGADRAHPAFAKLFLETEFDPAHGALLARRRPRSTKEQAVWAVHRSVADGDVEYETDRARFLGRGRTPANPVALEEKSVLSGTTGPVLDPVFSLRRRIVLDAGATSRLVFVTGAAASREAAVGLTERFGDIAEVDRAFTDARAASRKEMREFDLTADEIALFNRLAAAVVFTGPDLRDPDAIAVNRLGQPRLWPHAISGDLPIVLVRVQVPRDEAIVREMVRWHGYAQRCGLKSDLAVLDERSGDAVDRLRQDLEKREGFKQPGGVFHLSDVPAEDAVLLRAAARAILGGNHGSLAEQLDGRAALKADVPPSFVRRAAVADPDPARAERQREALSFWNGFGGFTQDGHEYVIVAGNAPDGSLPPAPWTNVLANPEFGCLVTEGGLGYSWAGNSQMNRLTPWSNDPSSDAPSEVLYLRDEDTGEVWTPTPLPLGAQTTVRHGQGYTRYAGARRSLGHDLLVFVPRSDPVKLLRLSLRNDGNRVRHLSATYYAEWVLGTVRENAALQVVCEHDVETGAILARNHWAGNFADKVAFAACTTLPKSVTAARAEFLGELGSVFAPDALRRVGLSGSARPALDPCAALLTELTLLPGETKDVIFVLGQADNVRDVRELIGRYARPQDVDAALAEVHRQWDHCLGSLQVTTPDPGMDLMLNRWLLYQVLACRLWARSAFYQSGGAYGFRDQLQDVMALVYGAPGEARAQILRAAARQFEEGDVQHWWHPPSGIGVRTRITDDLYFLPLVVHHYVTTTGDAELLNELVPFIASPVLRDDQEEDFNLPAASGQSATVYEHCLRALRHGYRLGPHGLPLMGTGDWNDGMNKVGAHGKGESVWNGWFFVSVLGAFVELADQRGESRDAEWCRKSAEKLRAALEAHAWDGGWYRRAYFDDGTPLGSAENDECQIDAIPQAWAVISSAADPARADAAMAAVQQRLVRDKDRLIQLFDPPFDKSALEPGYIKGYVPGIRENGGQYTHAATWVVLATALQGNGDRAVELWNLINPIRHTGTPEEVEHYKVEPYVVCADVYGAPPHTGRGGWTWYTGSASWLYRVAVEAILGFRLRGEMLHLEPCIPANWPGFELRYRYRSATYRILVDNAAHAGRGVCAAELDGENLPDSVVPLKDDGGEHLVRLRLG